MIWRRISDEAVLGAAPTNKSIGLNHDGRDEMSLPFCSELAPVGWKQNKKLTTQSMSIESWNRVVVRYYLECFIVILYNIASEIGGVKAQKHPTHSYLTCSLTWYRPNLVEILNDIFTLLSEDWSLGLLCVSLSGNFICMLNLVLMTRQKISARQTDSRTDGFAATALRLS